MLWTTARVVSSTAEAVPAKSVARQPRWGQPDGWRRRHGMLCPVSQGEFLALSPTKQSIKACSGLDSRCEWRDSNPHRLPYRNLNPARLPVPPHSLGTGMLPREVGRSGVLFLIVRPSARPARAQDIRTATTLSRSLIWFSTLFTLGTLSMTIASWEVGVTKISRPLRSSANSTKS